MTQAPSLRPQAVLAVISFTLGASFCGSAAQTPPPELPRSSTGLIVNGGVSLRYLLERPPGAGPFPAVVVGHGSGETHKEDFPAAARLLGMGFVVLRYDKRGVGESTGTYSMVGIANSEKMFADLSSDMAAGAAFLRTLPDVDRTRIGLVGPSQAGWIIPVAAKLSHPAFMILLVGPTVTGRGPQHSHERERRDSRRVDCRGKAVSPRRVSRSRSQPQRRQFLAGRGCLPRGIQDPEINDFRFLARTLLM